MFRYVMTMNWVDSDGLPGELWIRGCRNSPGGAAYNPYLITLCLKERPVKQIHYIYGPKGAPLIRRYRLHCDTKYLSRAVLQQRKVGTSDTGSRPLLRTKMADVHALKAPGAALLHIKRARNYCCSFRVNRVPWNDEAAPNRKSEVSDFFKCRPNSICALPLCDDALAI